MPLLGTMSVHSYIRNTSKGRSRMQELGLELDTRTVGRSSGSHLRDFRTKGILYQVTSKGVTRTVAIETCLFGTDAFVEKVDNGVERKWRFGL
jgi:hypothetical protein